MAHTLVSPTVSNLRYSPTLKLANAFARATEVLGMSIGLLDVDSIVDAARRQTGLTDVGDEAFLHPMRVVAKEVAAKEEFTPLARIILRQSWIRAVCNRLWLEDWLKRHPRIVHTPVNRPIFVLGFPRTGTTLLQNLLAEQDGRRGLPFWELTIPVPTHEDREIDRDTRRRTAKRMLQAAYQAAPEMAAVHAIDVDTLEECWPLFANSFAVMNWELQSGLENYGDWLLSSWDMRAPYAEYKRYLQVLLDRRPAEQLVLKCPEHLWFVDSLLHVFPDACVVWTHRDPYDTLASYCSLMSLQWRTLFGRIDREEIGAFMERRMLVGIERAMAARAHLDPARFFDVRFEDLVADPAAVVRNLTAKFDLPTGPDADAKVAAYLSRKRTDERGQHKYDGQLYGLDRAEVHARYGAYIDRFGISVGR
ncbi:MAG: sulfotransferase [Myxococcota bacterium]